MVKIAFWLNELCERGTAIAVYDYAFFNETILGNSSYILYEKNNPNNNDKVIEKFNKMFNVQGFKYFGDVDEFLLQEDIKILYIIKAGFNDKKISQVAKNFIHCVFDVSDPHGDVYTAISNSVNGYVSQPVLPHIVYLPEHNEDMRDTLNIPHAAVVYGRHGGKHQFDISGVHAIIYDVAVNNPNIYFIFVNTQVFCAPVKNIIHLEAIIDLHEKRKFINTCDAMIWARSDGETFGLSIAEFSLCNKPIIAFLHHENITANFHIKTLKNNAMWFKTSSELINILLTFDKGKTKHMDWNMYKEYTPEKVMAIFQKLVL